MEDFVEALIRHSITFIIVAVIGASFWAGYASGQHGQWWWGLSSLIFYPIIIKILDE